MLISFYRYFEMEYIFLIINSKYQSKNKKMKNQNHSVEPYNSQKHHSSSISQNNPQYTPNSLIMIKK